MSITKRQRTKYPGVYQRDSERLHGVMDIAFDISYKRDRKKQWEKIGWKSQGYSALLAKKVRDERIRAINHGDELPTEKQKAPLLSDVWTKYEKWAKNNKARQGRDDIYQYNNHLKDRFDNKRLNEISSFDLERLKAYLTKNKLSPASVRHCLVLLRQIYNKAILWGMYQGLNPIKGVKLPVLQNQRTRFLSNEEATRLLKYLKAGLRIKNPSKRAKASPSVLHDLALLSLQTGMRAGECFALKGQDVDPVNGIITIRNPKNKTLRHAYMTNAVAEMLKRRKPENPSFLVFPDRKGNQAQAISQAFRRAVSTLEFNKGVDDSREMVTFHTLRHTFASWLALQGETLQTIKELLGHKSMTMTERYSHLTPDHKRRATLALERGFQTNTEEIKNN